MNKVNIIKDKLTCEVNQTKALQKKLILQILLSKRLLAEHLEILEEISPSFLYHDSYQSNYLSLLSTSGVVASSYLMFNFFKSNLRYFIPCAAGIVPVLYLNKRLNLKQRNDCEAGLSDFIKALDDFEFSVKKATNFINDVHYTKTTGDLKRYNDISVCISNIIKRVIRGLYCFIKYLEFCIKMSGDLFYEEIDDIDNCPLMLETGDVNISPSKFKELFSLFAYVQSFMLLRLGIIFASNIEQGKFVIKKKICDMQNKIKHQTTLLPNFILMQTKEAELKENIQKLMDAQIGDNVPKELLQIRSSTADFTLKILSLIIQTQDYQEDVLQLIKSYQNMSNNALEEILNSLEEIGSQIATCSDEHDRLTILMKKYINKENVDEMKIPNEAIKPDAQEPELKIIDQAPPQSDDFFYVDPQNEQKEEVKECDNNEDLEEEDWQIKRTKKTFKPVLEQLKDRIGPIAENMKEREKKVLKEKGIEIDQDWNEPENNLSGNEYDSDDEDFNKKKKQRNQKKYDENRDFLQAKSQVNIFESALMFPTQNKFITLEEDVLE